MSKEPTSVAQTLSLLQQAEAVSVDTKVRIQHPDWTTLRAEVNRILTHSSAAMPDPMQADPMPSHRAHTERIQHT
ncbi:hypothetical protein [Streptomyces sp. NPDC008137]|uniref:hypothetical protein n=1 Tax=Streptomyces sp. NPDC008137 TaxID=3364813 RepID=UPI0036E36ABF